MRRSIALFISLGGVSYAVAAGSIDSREIKNNAVQTQDVRDGGLLGRDIGNGSVQSRDLRDGAVRGDREINEPDLDVQRLAGIDAGRYVKNVRRVEAPSANDPATPKSVGPASCPKGKRLLGGGARVVAPAGTPVALSVNAPSGNGWEASAYATAPTGNWQLVAVAICG